jgi:hypothetical protein
MPPAAWSRLTGRSDAMYFIRQRIPPIPTASDPRTYVADTSKCGWKGGIKYFGPGSGSHHSAVMDGDGPWSRERLFGRAGRCE